MLKKVKSPIGLTGVVDKVEDICNVAPRYRNVRQAVPNLIVALDSGEGQTTVTRYAAYSFKEYGVREFRSLETFLEFKTDGSWNQVVSMFDEIKESAIYTNEYMGIVSIDISALANCLNEEQVELFLKEIRTKSKYATFIFFIPSVPNSEIKELVSSICDVLDYVEVIPVRPYSADELAEIAKEMLISDGIRLDDSTEMDITLRKMVISTGTSDVKGVGRLVNSIKKTVCSGGVPSSLSTGAVQAIVTEIVMRRAM